MVTIYGQSKSVTVTGTPAPLGVEIPACDGVWIQVYGSPITFTCDGRTPEAGVTGKTAQPGDTITIAPEDVQYMIAVSSGTSTLDIDFLSTRS